MFRSHKRFGPKMSKFNLTHQFKFTTELGTLVPVLTQEVVPGDIFNISSNHVLRFLPLIAPLMHEVDVYIHYFFVPNRLLWSNWETFITGSVQGKYHGKESTVASVVSPYVTSGATGFGKASLADYFNINPTSVGLKVSALPFRAYNHIYNDWYLSEDVMDPAVINLADGSDTTTNTSVLRRLWNRDYFTTCLPYAQKGPATSFALGAKAPVLGLYTTNASSWKSMSDLGITSLSGSTGGYTPVTGDTFAATFGTGHSNVGIDPPQVIPDVPSSVSSLVVKNLVSSANPGVTQSGPDVYADLGSVSAFTINELREAFQIQRYLEKDARCGSRYVEFILAHFGVRSSDSRLQRSEYLGGKKTPVVFSEVLQTSESEAVTPQGNMAGHGFSASSSPHIRRRFEEHGWLMGLMSIMPRTSYQEGIPRQFLRTSRFDYLNPEFVHLGEQGVYNKEIYAKGDAADDNLFGYQSRFEEYRRIPSHVAGDMRDTLDYWHAGRIFGDTRPALNSTFLQCTPTPRIFAVEPKTSQPLLVQLENVITAVRCLPKVAQPGFIDHGF